MEFFYFPTVYYFIASQFKTYVIYTQYIQHITLDKVCLEKVIALCGWLFINFIYCVSLEETANSILMHGPS